MGKIIVKNISLMGWKARIGLVAIFTLVFSILIFQGGNQHRSAQAAVALGTAWQSVHAAAPNTAVSRNGNYAITSAGSYTAAAGVNRLLLVAVAYEFATATTADSGITVTMGGVTVTQIATTNVARGTAMLGHVWLGYIADASIPAASSTVTATFSKSGAATTVSSVAIKVGTYTGVDQASPIAGSNANYAASVTVASNAAVSYILGGKTIAAANNGGVTATPAYTATPALTANAGATSTTGQSAYIAESAAHASSSSYASGGISITYTGTTTANSALAVASLRPATTTLGNGVAGTPATVAPGTASQKLDGFSLVTGSAGTTDAITGLTVTTTGNTAIGSIAIWNEAGTTQYFTTVNNPGSNTIVFSGGTPIPVTSTAANFKVLVTYKTRAGGAPTGSTATTAYVSAITSSNLIVGTDTADTTLTLANIHAASSWGACSAGDNAVTINWTYGTSGQSVVVIRYTANSDTTKPTDGTTYATGNAFGSGGTVRYVGAGTILNDTVGIVNGTTYYYKIFEYDAYKNYYNATDVWTSALTPVTSDPSPPVVDPGFTATTPVKSVNIPITSYGASDIGLGVAGYLVTTTSTPPAAGAAGWTPTPPATFTVGGQGSYTLYPWAKDAGGNVSAVYGAPVTVIVDLTRPTVTAFTVAGQVASQNIPLSLFTTSDTGGSSMAAYMVTTTNTPPAFDAEGWNGVAPATYTVGADGSYTLYPWAKDGAGNVSLVFGSPRTVLVDTTAPTGLAQVAPADEAVNLPITTTLSSSVAADSGSGGVLYQFQISSDDPVYSQNSGWQAGTSYAPTGLVKGAQYLWSVKAKDSLGNETPFTASRTFSIIAPCVRNNPTLTLLTAGGGIASTISADSGTSTYKLRVINNDTGDCGSSTFALTTIDDFFPAAPDQHFLDSVFVETGLRTNSVTLPAGTEVTKDVRVAAKPAEDNGVAKTTVRSAADAGASHAEYITSFVQTTINVVTCQPKVPLLIVGPDSGYVNRGGKMVYTITLKNTDTGAGCAPVTYNLSLASESNGTDYNASQFNTTSLVLNSGELKSATLTVSAKSTALRDAVNNSSIALAASGHTSPANITVRTTVNNPMLHNSDNTGSTKWSVSGWGIPNGRYGEIRCTTCHVGGGGDTPNIKRMNEKIYTPYTTGGLPHFPGEGKSIAYRRYVGISATQPVLGWDSGASPRPTPTTTKICEACHTYDATKTNGVLAHPFATSATLGNHFNTDGKDCTKCHKHNKGFGAVNMVCNSCHGDATVIAAITAANRNAVAPPTSATGTTGVLTGTGKVSNDPKVGAHQTHLLFSNGFSNYSTVDFRCENCHGTLPVSGSPTQFVHANGSSIPAFQGLATNRNARTPAYNSANLTCSNTYCHDPAGTGGSLAAANAGFAIFPSWTSAGYTTAGTLKTQNNCNRCHKVPGDAGFSFQGSHGTMVTNQATDCSVCHGHNGDASGPVGKRHIDGIRYASGGHEFPYPGAAHLSDAGTTPWSTCTNCHTNGANTLYPTVTRGTAPDCTGCHTLGLKTPSGTSSCYDCHGASATDGRPNGNAFPNYSGSHTRHVVGQSMACTDCHGPYGGGIGDRRHGFSNRTAHTFSFVNVTSTTAKFKYSAAGKGSCSSITCHGNAEWGTSLACNSCHGYDTTDSGTTWLPALKVSGGSGAGSHVKHINFIKSRLNIVSLTAGGQTFGAGETAAVCGTCHTNTFTDHTVGLIGSRNITFGSGTFIMGSGYSGSMSLLFGGSNPSFNTTAKTCSNLLCHYAITPNWY